MLLLSYIATAQEAFHKYPYKQHNTTVKT